MTLDSLGDPTAKISSFVLDLVGGRMPYASTPSTVMQVVSIGGAGNANPSGTIRLRREADPFDNGYNYPYAHTYTPVVNDWVTVVNTPTYPIVTGRLATAATDTAGLTRWAMQKVTTPVASITVSGFPASFAQLLLFWGGRSTAAATYDNLVLRMNGDTGLNYDYQSFQAAGSSLTGLEQIGVNGLVIGVINATLAPTGFAGAGATALLCNTMTGLNASFASIGWFATGTTSTTHEVLIIGGHWKNTATVTSLTFLPLSGHFDAGSYVGVYGL